MESYSEQIVEYHSDTITLNEETLRSILTKDEVKDRYVSIISVTGGFRQGKSFLLNFLLRYLRVKYIEKRDVSEWLKPEDGPLKGFSWAPGSNRDTNGIHMWSEIFLTEIPSGENVAIILLDTQGSFDNESTMDDCARIFALSTLISSVQIYNVMRGIKQYDLTHLQYFGGYSRLLTNCDSAPFQNLCFLVRDWACAYEHPHGNIGGLEFLEKVFDSKNPEVRKQVANIKELFNEIDCFLLPYPGQTVDTSDSFDGNLNDIDDLFKQHVQDFAAMFLSPEKLVLKTINGNKIKAEELMFYISEYSNVLKEGALPKVENVFMATVEAQHRAASFEALKLYRKNMDEEFELNLNGCTSRELDNKHSTHKTQSVDYFNNLKKFDDEALYYKYLEELKDNMGEEFNRYRTTNEEKLRKFKDTMKAHYKAAFSRAMEQYKKNMDALLTRECCEPHELDVKHSNYRTRAIYFFNNSKVFFGEAVSRAVYNKYLDDLAENMDVEFEDYRKKNEENKRKKEEKQRADRAEMIRQALNVALVAATLFMGPKSGGRP